MNILYITSELPYPLDRGAAIRGYHLLKWLGAEHQITLLSLTEKEPQEVNEVVNTLSLYCRRVRTFPIRDLGALEEPFEALKFVIRGVPIDLRRFDSAALSEEITAELASNEPDVIAIEHTSMMQYLGHIPENLLDRTVALSHDVDFLKFRRLAELEPDTARRLRLRLHARMLQRWEPRMAEKFALYTTVSKADRDALLAVNSRLNVAIVPNGVDATGLPLLPEAPTSRPARLLFIGNLGYRPNIDAVAWLAKDVLPRIQELGHEAQLDVVGVGPTNEILDLASPSVHVIGAVPDVVPAYEAAHVSLVPLRAGGGTRLKILEAMALGRPVVSTSIGCEGLDVEDGVHLLIADAAAGLAAKTVQLLTDSNLRHNMVLAARELVERRYDWGAIAGELARQVSAVSSTMTRTVSRA